MTPDMTLENNAQNKQFTADKKSVHKKAHVNAFYLEKKSQEKSYSGARDFRPKEFNSKSYRAEEPVADSLRDKTAAQFEYSESSKGARTKQAYDQNKSPKSRQYAGTRPYLEQGKSQKSLNRKNRPMTIDEVRELLNKNK